MKGYYCAYRNCSSKTGEGLSFFRFPKDYESARVWIEACIRQDLLYKIENVHKNYRLCEKHFENKYISKGNVRKTLLPNATPTQFPHLLRKRQNQLEENIPEQPPKKVILLLVPQQALAVDGPSTSRETDLNETIVGSVAVRDMSPPLSLSPTSPTQTDSSSSSSRAPRKQRLRAKVRGLRRVNLKKRLLKENKMWTLKDFNELCDIFLSKPLSDIVKTHAALKDKKPISRRYSLGIKRFALTLYFLSPRAYGYLSKLLILPTKRSLQTITQQISCKPGLENPAIFKVLKIKTKTMLEQDKHCILCIGETALKSNLFFYTGRDEIVVFEDTGDEKDGTYTSKNALVIMARGLYSPWKQPVGYFIVGPQLKAKNIRPILEKCVSKLSNIGLYVEGIASDMGSNFMELANLLGVTSENSEFELEGKKLVYIFDPCHLIKATRDNLLKHSFHFGDKKTSWSFIQIFYEQDKKQFCRCAPKLTDAHTSPSNFETMDVSLAAQVISQTVAGGMNTYMSLNALPADSIGTIETLGMFNNLFDLLNSLSLRHTNKYKNVFDGSEFQIDFFAEAITFLKDLKIFNTDNQDITNGVKFHKCWIVTINSVLKLWEKLSESDFMHLKTRRLSTDCIEKFFESMRQQSGSYVNPTPIQFQRAFRKLFWQHYFHSNHALPG